MSFEDARRSIRLDVHSEIDSWRGYRYDTWKDEDGTFFRRSIIYVAPEIEPIPEDRINIDQEAFDKLWEKMLETSKDRDSVGEPDYVMREIMLMDLDPMIWVLKAKEKGTPVMDFNVSGGPRTPLQKDLCDLLKAFTCEDDD